MKIDKINLQDMLFDSVPSYNTLKNYKTQMQTNATVSIYRNHSFELIENIITPYLNYGNIQAEFEYSDYDDSLSFLNINTQTDLLVLWIDLSRYSIENINSFISERIAELKKIYTKNILFIPLCGDLIIKDEQVITYSFTPIKEKLSDKFLDLRMEPFSGTKLSHQSQMALAFDLGLNYFPAMLQPLKKGIVLDLDNTLYQGVLGEDGVNGVILTEEHRLLQEKLKKLSQLGFFLSIASKNDEKDVLDLFEMRRDFPLKLSDFTKICANWNDKSNSITEIANFININSNSLIFIDDNLGEIASVLQMHPEIDVVWAKNATLTCNVLANTPGLLKLNIKQEDSLRKGDVVANEQRRILQNNLTIKDYIKQLDIELNFNINNISKAARIAELSNKTNQFIFTYKRYSLVDIERMMKSANFSVVDISLRDKLTDSGVIGAVVVENVNGVGVLQECFISCRALGRGIDREIVLTAIDAGLKRLHLNKLEVKFVEGDRNLPALNFITQHFSSFYNKVASFVLTPNEYEIKITIDESDDND